MSVAASLIRIALAGRDPTTIRAGVYDPFCGTGTIPAEATRMKLPVFASDTDEQAVALTRERLAKLAPKSGQKPGKTGATDIVADLQHRVFVHDVHRGFPPRVGAHVIVSNLPWGKQAKVERRTELFDATAVLVARVVTRGGSCALLTTHEDQLIARLRRRAKNAHVEARRIGLLGQTPAIVTAQQP